MNELQAALGLAVLDCLAEEIDRRKALLQLYRRTLGAVDGVTMMEEPPGVESSYQYCAIRIDEARFGCSRDDVHRELMNHNVISRKYFFPLCSDYACYRDLPSADPARLPVARTAAMQVLCLPLYGSLPPATVAAHLRNHRGLSGRRCPDHLVRHPGVPQRAGRHDHVREDRRDVPERSSGLRPRVRVRRRRVRRRVAGGAAGDPGTRRRRSGSSRSRETSARWPRSWPG